MFLSDVSIKRPVFATMMMLALVTLGFFSYRRLSIDEWPNVQFPFIVVQTIYPGASPETVERDVTRKIEEAVNPIAGVRNLTSSSLEGLSSIFIEFELNVKDIEAQQDVRSKIEEIRELLPDDIENPKVLRFNLADIPIVSLALRSDTRSLRELTTLADETIRKEFEGVDGVGQVTLVGGEKRAIAVELDPETAGRAGGHGRPGHGCAGRPRTWRCPPGRLELGPGEQLVRVAGTPGASRPISTSWSSTCGTACRSASATWPAPSTTPRRRARPPWSTARRPSASTSARSPAATRWRSRSGSRRRSSELKKNLPPGVELSIVRDDSVWIRDSVEDVKTTILIGALLTVLVVFTFLNSWRSTVITGLTLPVSVIAAFLAIYAFGYTLNTMTLMALSLAIGILIDDAIVVRENIVRHVGMGEDHYTAARRGTSEIGLAVLATTLSTLCVFVPVAFMGGIVGKFFREFGVTVAAAVAVSLFVSFTLDPMLSSVWYDPVAEGHAARGPVGRALEKLQPRLRRPGQALPPDRRLGALAPPAHHRHRGGRLRRGDGALPAGGRDLHARRRQGAAHGVGQGAGRLHPRLHARPRARGLRVCCRRYPEVAYTYETIAGGFTAQVNEAEIYVKLAAEGNSGSSPRRSWNGSSGGIWRPLPGMTVAVLDAGGFGGSQRPIQIYVQRGPDRRAAPHLGRGAGGGARDARGHRSRSRGSRRSVPRCGSTCGATRPTRWESASAPSRGTLRPALAGREGLDLGGSRRGAARRHRAAAEGGAAVGRAAGGAAAGRGGRDPQTGAPRIVRLGQVADIQAEHQPAEDRPAGHEAGGLGRGQLRRPRP